MKKNIRLLLLASFLCIFLFGNMVLAATPKAPSPAPAPKAPVTTPLSAPDKAIKDTTISIQKANLEKAISFYDKFGSEINFLFKQLYKKIYPGTTAFLKKEKAVLLAQTNPEIVSTRTNIVNSLSHLIDKVIAVEVPLSIKDAEPTTPEQMLNDIIEAINNSKDKKDKEKPEAYKSTLITTAITMALAELNADLQATKTSLNAKLKKIILQQL